MLKEYESFCKLESDLDIKSSSGKEKSIEDAKYKKNKKNDYVGKLVRDRI